MTMKSKPLRSKSKKSKITGYVSDFTITTKIKTLFATDDALKALRVHIKTNAGVALLVGYVPSQGIIDKIKELVAGVKGVREIVANLEVEK